MTGDLPRAKRGAQCLSGFKISRLACALMPPAEELEARQHLRQCADCAARLEAEAAGVAAARLERLPQSLQEAHQASEARAVRGLRPWWGAAPALVVAVAVLLVMVGPSEQPTERTKGGLGLQVSVLREGALLHSEVDVGQLVPLRPGDRLRARVVGATGAWTVLQGREGGRWTSYFEGALPADRWLPVGIAITADGESSLRVLSCRDKVENQESALVSGACEGRVYELPVER